MNHLSLETFFRCYQQFLSKFLSIDIYDHSSKNTLNLERNLSEIIPIYQVDKSMEQAAYKRKYFKQQNNRPIFNHVMRKFDRNKKKSNKNIAKECLCTVRQSTQFIEKKALTSPFSQQTINIYLLKFRIFTVISKTINIQFPQLPSEIIFYYMHIQYQIMISITYPPAAHRHATILQEEELFYFFSFLIHSAVAWSFAHKTNTFVHATHSRIINKSTSQLYYTIFLFTNIFYSSR